MSVQPPSLLEAAMNYKRRGLAPVYVPPGRKGPDHTGWNERALREDELPDWFDRPGNIGIRLGPASGDLVDADLDCDEAVEMAEKFLPATSCVTGRPSRPRSHRWFFAKGAVTRQFKDPVTNEMICELRAEGVQTLVGPSVHPDDRDRYDMLEGEPAVVDADHLAACLEALANAVIKRRHGDLPPKPSPPAASTEQVARCSDAADVAARAAAYLKAMPPAISGQGGHSQTFTAARALVRGFGLSTGTALRLLTDHYNPRCQPPWTDKELRHKVDDADTKPHDKPYGWLRDAPRANGAEHTAAGVNGNSHPPAGAPAPPTQPPNRTDLGNAERLVRRFGERLRYCHATGKWLVWDELRWKEDDEGASQFAAAQTARNIMLEAAACDDPDDRKAAAKWALSSESRNRIEGMVALARSQPQLVVRAHELDADLWAFNVLNGTIDLRTGEIRPHRREDLITKLSPVEYNSGAECPLFIKFLDRIFASDSALIGYVQRVLGMCLTGDVKEQLLQIFHGCGANGKSVLLDTVKNIMSEYAGDAAPTLLTQSRNSEHPTEVADLWGKRLVIASETEQEAQLKLQLVKRLTGDATLKARFMRQDFFQFQRTHKLILVTNNMPRVREDSEAVWRRLRLVPFKVVIPPHERDPALLEKLWEERAGILAWMVRGCLEWQRGGLNAPAAVLSATSAYREAEDGVGRYLDERCVLDFQPEKSGKFTPWSVLRKDYEEWGVRSGEAVLSSRAFGEALDKHGYPSATQRRGGRPTKGRPGINLADDRAIPI